MAEASFRRPLIEQGRGPRIGIVLATLLAIGGAAAGAYFWNAQRLTERGAAGPVADDSQQKIPAFIVAPGKVEPVDGQLQLAFDTPGVLRKLHVREGDWVKQGAVLGELVNDELAARLEAAKSSLAEASAKLRLMEIGSRQEDVDEARAELSRTETTTRYFGSLLDRRENLFKRNAASKEEVLDHQLRFDEAKKREEAAAARLKRLEAGSRPEEIAMARAAKGGAEARIRELEASLERTRLRAPREGKILRVLRREGESIMGLEALPVVSMADVRRLQIRAEVDETQIPCAKTDLAVRFSPYGVKEVVYEGTLTRVNDLMGRKQLTTDDPREKVDVRVLEVIVTPKVSADLRINQRVDVFIPVAPTAPPAAGS